MTLSAAHIRAEADGVLTDIASALTTAAAIHVEAGFKPPKQLLRIVQAVAGDPALVTRVSIEDEALCLVARHYQRADEKPGTHWYDVTGCLEATGINPDLDFERVREAARSATAVLQSIARKGRRQDVAGDHLALMLGGIFNRFAGPIKRVVLRDG